MTPVKTEKELIQKAEALILRGKDQGFVSPHDLLSAFPQIGDEWA